LKIISNDPGATATLTAEELNISDRTVKRHLSALVEKGIVKRIGSDKTGRWEIQ